MERTVARKLAQDLERRNVHYFAQTKNGTAQQKPLRRTQPDSHTMSTKDFRGSNKLAVAVDLEDACNRVPFKLLMELHVQYGVSLTLTRWLAAALQQRQIAKRLGNSISTPQQLTMGLPQGSPLSPVLYNVYTKGLANLNSNGLSRVLTLADDRLIYKTASDTHTTVTAVQEQLEKCYNGAKRQSPGWSKSRCISLWCRIPRIHSTMLSKEKRGVEWQEASPGWAKQNSQSSVCAASQSSSK